MSPISKTSRFVQRQARRRSALSGPFIGAAHAHRSAGEAMKELNRCRTAGCQGV